MQEFPKWVTPHESLVIRSEGKPTIVQRFPTFYVKRDDSVEVLVSDKDEEAIATAAPKSAEVVPFKPIFAELKDNA